MKTEHAADEREKHSYSKLHVDLAEARRDNETLVDALEKYMQAMDAIYNHDVVTRSVVAKYFGTTHPPEVIRLLREARQIVLG